MSGFDLLRQFASYCMLKITQKAQPDDLVVNNYCGSYFFTIFLFTAKCPGDNEIYDPCDAPCPARRCDFDATVVKCGKPPQVGDDACLVGCRCKDGFLRNNKNVCIPADECRKYFFTQDFMHGSDFALSILCCDSCILDNRQLKNHKTYTRIPNLHKCLSYECLFRVEIDPNNNHLICITHPKTAVPLGA